MFEQAADLPSATSSNNGGFRWDPSSLPRALIDLDEVVAQFGDDAIKVVASPSGDYVATYHVDNGQFDVTITARAADGYNISRVEFVDSTGHTTGAKACEWRKDGHDWYVSKLSRTIGAHVFTLNYAEFVPNAKIDEHLFELDSMGLNEGARIIDQRRGSDQLGAVTIFRYTKRETKQSADLVSAARAMPPKQPVRTIVVDHSAAMWRRIRLSGTILVVVGLAGAIIIRAIRRRNCGE